jgi:hypothetical protein
VLITALLVFLERITLRLLARFNRNRHRRGT